MSFGLSESVAITCYSMLNFIIIRDRTERIYGSENITRREESLRLPVPLITHTNSLSHHLKHERSLKIGE